jgi:hypothetical protein
MKQRPNEGIKSQVGINLAIDFFNDIGFKSQVTNILELAEEIIERMPDGATTEDMLEILDIAKKTVPQIGG